MISVNIPVKKTSKEIINFLMHTKNWFEIIQKENIQFKVVINNQKI